MTERTIFLQALEQATPAERARFIEQSCGGDAALRLRIEALLRSHEQAGSFLGTPAPQAIADRLVTPNAIGDTQSQVPAAAPAAAPVSGAAPSDAEPLDFLSPSGRPGALGRLGHYEVLEVIGKGGMGIVLKAIDQKLEREVAIKVLAPGLAANGIARQRFAREVRAAAAVTHEHLVAIHTVEEDHRPPYLVMQLVNGVSLQQRLHERGPLAVKEVVRLGMQVASGLAAAHAHGLIHRDVKPANILLESGREYVKLTDFGLARAADDDSITQTGVIAGTPAYMSPEQAEGKTVDHRSDLFSLGSVLYAMCTGNPPFRASSSMAVLKRVCEETQVPIREINPSIPDWLAEIVERLHAKNPADRFQSATEVAEALAERLAWMNVPAGMPQSAVPSATRRPPSQRATRKTWGVVAAVLAMLVAGFGLTEALDVTSLRAPVLRFFTPAEVSPAPGAGHLGGEAFVLLAGGEERKFATLADAVAMANNNDTIEIRDPGPFLSESITIKGSLIIRAAEGVRPVLQLRAEPPSRELLQTDFPLVLEGLELRREGPDATLPGQPQPRLVQSSNGGLYVTNCRFVVQGDGGSIAARDSQVFQVRNCEFVSSGRSYGQLSWRSPPAGRLDLENCVIAGDSGLAFWFENRDLRDVRLRLVHNTLCVRTAVQFSLNRPPDTAPANADKGVKPVSLEVAANVVDARKGVLLFDQAAGFFVPARDVLLAQEAETLLPRLLGWREQPNLYPEAVSFLNLSVKTGPYEPTRVRKSLADWQQFWGATDSASLQGRIRYQGGDVFSRALKAPQTIGAAEFRLHPDDASTYTGKDGRALGADVDLVGPGVAYERWRKTPDYQRWLKLTGQVQ